LKLNNRLLIKGKIPFEFERDYALTIDML